MNISENKRVIAITALFGVAFAGVCYYGYSRSSQFSADSKELSAISERYQDYENDTVPSAAALKGITEANKKLKQINEGIRADFKSYADFCAGDGKQISAQDFQNNLRASIAEMNRQAQQSNCSIASPAADMGFKAYINAAPVQEDVPMRSFQLKAVSRVAEAIISSGSPLLDKIYCAPLPDEKARKAAYSPLGFEMAFNAKRGSLPAVINSIVSDKQFFLMLTGIAVSNDNGVGPLDAYQEPVSTASQGDDISAADGNAEATVPATRTIAVRKSGDPSEVVRVHMTLQAIYFNPSPSKRK